MAMRMKTYLLCTLFVLAAGGSAVAEEGEEGFGGNFALISQEGDTTGDTNMYVRAHYSWLFAPELSFFVEGELGRGSGFAPPVVTHWQLNDTAYDTFGAVILRQFYLRLSGNESYGGLLGQVDLSEHFSRNEFAKNEFSQFMMPGLVTDPIIDFPSFGGPSVESVAAKFSYTLTPSTTVRVAGAEYRPDWGDILHDDTFWITEFEQKLGDKGKVIVDLWTAPEQNPGWGGRDVPLGLSVSFDFDVADFGIFGRLGVRDKDLYTVDSAFSLGFIYTGSALGEDNALGFGMLTTRWSADFIAAGGGPVSDGNETQFEVFYRWTLPAGLEIIPDLQVIVNPGGDTTAKTVTIFGVRVHTPF